MADFRYQNTIIKLLIILIAMLGCADTYAHSCFLRIKLILKCENKDCKEGFFAFQRLRGEWCTSVLYVTEDQRIYNISGILRTVVNRSEVQDGIYSIEIIERPFTNDDNIKSLTSFKYNEPNEISAKENYCGGPQYHIQRLDYPSNETLPNVIKDYAKKSRIERIKSGITFWIFPIIMVGIIVAMLTKFRSRNNGKITLVIFMLSTFGLAQGIFGMRHWVLPGLIGLLYCIVWTVVKITKAVIQRLERRKNND